MPSKNVIRNFVEGGIYHVYNRGVEKRPLFLDEQDYHIFLYYLFVYLAPLERVLLTYPDLPLRFYSKNLSKDLELLSFCLMPNHFHLLLKTNVKNGISNLMRRITNAYTLYFNNKYQRIGGLMQGRYKAVSITDDEQLIHVSRYIHLNPLVANLTADLEEYRWSSSLEYTKDKQSWGLCNTDTILSYFDSKNSYRKFMSDHLSYARELDKIKHLVLEDSI